MSEQNLLQNIDAFPPPKIAERCEAASILKAKLDFWTLMVLSILAGSFIVMGAMFSTTVTAGADGYVCFGLNRLLGGLAFCLGLILVVVAGAELFTGNNLIIMAFVAGRITMRQLMRNWIIVYAGNFYRRYRYRRDNDPLQTVPIRAGGHLAERIDPRPCQMRKTLYFISVPYRRRKGLHITF